MQRIAIVDPTDSSRESLRTLLLGVDFVWLEAECTRYEYFFDVIQGSMPDLAIVSLDRELAPRDRSARLWAQTERLHAHAVARRWDDFPAAFEGLWRFLDVPVAGTWRDRLMPDGSFVQEAAPASSLYHIVSAAAALDSACAPAR